MENMGRIIQKLRLDRGVSQAELGKFVGVSSQAVSKWEAGSFPDAPLIPRIAEFFGVTTDYLFGIVSPEVEEKIEASLRNDLVRRERSEVLSAAVSYCREINAGVISSGIYKKLEKPEKGEGLALCVQPEGICMLRSSRKRDYFFLLDEKTDFLEFLEEKEDKIIDIMSFLGEKDNFRVFKYVHTRGGHPFTYPRMAKELGMEVESLRAIVKKLEAFRLIHTVIADDADGEFELIIINPNPAAKPFILFAMETAEKETKFISRYSDMIKPILK